MCENSDISFKSKPGALNMTAQITVNTTIKFFFPDYFFILFVRPGGGGLDLKDAEL